MQEQFKLQLYEHVKGNHTAEFYIERYIRYIEDCENHKFDSSLSFQRHHIVPRSWGGNNEPENLILLPLRHHFVAHHILSRTKDAKMLYAFHLMLSVNKNIQAINVQSYEYTNIKTTLSEARSWVRNKAVVNLNTGEVFDSLRRAVDTLPTVQKSAALTTAIKTRQLCGGYYWQYKSIVDKTTREAELEFCVKKREKTDQRQPVVNLNTGEEFESVKEACRHYNVKSKTGLLNALKRGVRMYGYFWQYKDIVDKNGREVELAKREEHAKGFRNTKKRAVINLSTGERFESINMAEKNRKKPFNHFKSDVKRRKPINSEYWQYEDVMFENGTTIEEELRLCKEANMK